MQYSWIRDWSEAKRLVRSLKGTFKSNLFRKPFLKGSRRYPFESLVIHDGRRFYGVFTCRYIRNTVAPGVHHVWHIGGCSWKSSSRNTARGSTCGAGMMLQRGSGYTWRTASVCRSDRSELRPGARIWYSSDNFSYLFLTDVFSRGILVIFMVL